MKGSYSRNAIQQSAFQLLFEQPPLTDFLFLYIMFKQEILTSEERECQKVARRRFREIVKQRWEEEKLKTLSQKAFRKIKRTENPEPELMALAEDAGGSFRMRFSKGVWYLHFTFFGKKVESSAPTLTEAINGLIINKHLNK